MRQITEHQDGHELNESIIIMADAPSNGGASHLYRFSINGREVGRLQFQRGPRHEEGNDPGVTDAAIIAVCIDRLRGFQSGQLACRENAIVLTKLEECLHWMKARADDRAKRRVLGTKEK